MTLVFSENLLHAANDLISMYCMFIKVFSFSE